jgi:5-methylcytosine-specific restriction endonuclease McrA
MSRTPLKHCKVERDLLRYQLFEVQHGCCHLCGKFMTLAVCPTAKAPSPNFATFDHVLPWSKGGTTYYTNLRLAHRRCNSKRGNQSLSGEIPHRAFRRGWKLTRTGTNYEHPI